MHAKYLMYYYVFPSLSTIDREENENWLKKEEQKILRIKNNAIHMCDQIQFIKTNTTRINK